MAASIERVLHDPMLKSSLASAGQSEVLRCFTMRRMVEEIDALYVQLLEEK